MPARSEVRRRSSSCLRAVWVKVPRDVQFQHRTGEGDWRWGRKVEEGVGGSSPRTAVPNFRPCLGGGPAGRTQENADGGERGASAGDRLGIPGDPEGLGEHVMNGSPGDVEEV